MKNYYKIVFVFILLTTPLCYAQEANKKGAAKSDTVQNIFKLQNEILNSYLRQKKYFNESYPLLNPGLDLSQLQSDFNRPGAYLVPDPLADFKKNLNKFLALKYSALPNYDMGVFTKFLKYVQMFTAFYFAAKSIR